MKKYLLSLVLLSACCASKQAAHLNSIHMYLIEDDGALYILDDGTLFTRNCVLAPQKSITTECVINSKRVVYNACTVGNLQQAKHSYKQFVYIGSGHVFYVNGVRNESPKLMHFFY